MIRYKHMNDSGFDLYATEDIVIGPHSFGIVPTQCDSKLVTSATQHREHIEKGYVFIGFGLYLWPKSGSDWLIGGGVVDVDYDDIVYVKVANIMPAALIIKKGQAVCQGVVQPVFQVKGVERGEHRNATGGIKSQYARGFDTEHLAEEV